MECLHSRATSLVMNVRDKLSSCFYYSLMEYRKFCSLVYVFKILHQISPPYLHGLFSYASAVTDCAGRNPHQLFVPRIRTNYGKFALYF